VSLKPGLGVIKVVGTDTNRSAAYDFLLTFRDNHRPIRYNFRDKRRFRSKIANFSHRRVFCAPAEGVLLEFVTGAGGKKTTMMGLPIIDPMDPERSLTISSDDAQ